MLGYQCPLFLFIIKFYDWLDVNVEIWNFRRNSVFANVHWIFDVRA